MVEFYVDFALPVASMNVKWRIVRQPHPPINMLREASPNESRHKTEID